MYEVFCNGDPCHIGHNGESVLFDTLQEARDWGESCWANASLVDDNPIVGIYKVFYKKGKKYHQFVEQIEDEWAD